MLLAHLTARIAAATSTNHGGLHCAPPPSAAGAGIVVNNRQRGLLQLGGELTSSCVQQYRKKTHNTTVSWKKSGWKKPSLDFMVLTDCFPMYASTAPNNLLYSVNAWYPYVRLTLGATPSTDIAGVFVRQNLVSRRQSGELDVVIESSIRCQTQEGNVIPERPAHSHFNE